MAPILFDTHRIPGSWGAPRRMAAKMMHRSRRRLLLPLLIVDVVKHTLHGRPLGVSHLLQPYTTFFVGGPALHLYLLDRFGSLMQDPANGTTLPVAEPQFVLQRLRFDRCPASGCHAPSLRIGGRTGRRTCGKKQQHRTEQYVRNPSHNRFVC